MRLDIILLSVSLALLASCGGEQPRRAAIPAASVAVQVVPVSSQQWPGVYEATGTVRARTAITVSSRLMAYVQQVSVQVGDHVREGQTIILLDARDLEANVRRAAAGQSEIQSAIPEAENGTAAAKANLDLAQATFHRMEDLLAKRSISSQEFDEAAARLKASQANYEMARSRRLQLDSKMAQAEQELGSATILREYARLAAPISGVVTSRSVEPGNLAAPGVPLLTIEQDGAYRMEASVDESRLPSVRPGQTVEVTLEALERKLNARVSEIVPSVDTASRAYVVKIDLPAIPQLRSGMFGRAIFPMGARTVATIPPSALIERGQLQSVFVAEDGTAHTRLITTGQRTNDGVEVLKIAMVGIPRIAAR